MSFSTEARQTFPFGRIELVRGPDCWLAYVPGNASVLDAFGTNLLPTPHTPLAPAQDVLAALRALNPDTEIVLREGEPPC